MFQFMLDSVKHSEYTHPAHNPSDNTLMPHSQCNLQLVTNHAQASA